MERLWNTARGPGRHAAGEILGACVVPVITSGDFMVKRPLLLCVCLALLLAASNASAQDQKPGTATDGSATSVKIPNNKASGASLADSGQSKKREVLRAESSKADPSKAKKQKNRKYKANGRDPSSLPIVEEDFAEKPETLMAELSTIPTDGSISSYYGMRRNSSRSKYVRMHTGVDIRAAQGTPVLAAAAGVSISVGNWAGYGKVVEIDHGNGLVTRYAHLGNYNLVVGDMVASGDQIGTIGRTGRSTGFHLHFETLVNGKYVDPMMAAMWDQAPDRFFAKRGIYVS
ncbi:MAG: M23 family metallopeptidase, partial [Deltaproteobacteria bacterium]|nr:M23 family metallopeptidase [Deltaproteobacteria bacterium]